MFSRIFICLSLCSSAGNCDLLIRDATVIDVVKGTRVHKCSILIHDDKIAAVGVGLTSPKHTVVIEAAGKYVIPGMWDMHVQLRGREQLPLYLAHGVTGVRDMGSELARVLAWRAAIVKDEILGPHIETCGPLIDGFPSNDPKLPVVMVRSPAEARSTFDRLDDQQADFIGVRLRLPREAYFALIERARKYYSHVAGPVPATVTALEAVDARQKSIDQMSGISLACSSEEKRLRAPRALAIDQGDDDAIHQAEVVAFETFSKEKADFLFERMARYETRSVPTLLRLRVSPDFKGLYEKVAQVVLQMQNAGVVIMAGSGSGPAGTHPGEELHEELELLVAAGLTPAQALRGVTSEAAKYFRAEESLGQVHAGKVADLVLLDADPLADIRNARKIDAVVMGGKVLAKAKLNAMKNPAIREAVRK
jgi:amidohydrolase family protein